jgi:hypothetical protein
MNRESSKIEPPALPRDGSVEHLPQRLCRFEAMPSGKVPRQARISSARSSRTPSLRQKESNLLSD